MSRNATLTLFTLAFCALAAFPALGQVAEAPTMTTEGSFDKSQAAFEQKQLAMSLLAAEGKGQPLGIVGEPSAAELERLTRAPAEEGRLLVGVTYPVEAAVQFEELEDKALVEGSLGYARGSLRVTDEGFTWFTSVRSRGATATRLHLTGLEMPRGAQLYVYSRLGEAFGPYIGKGPFGDGELWTHTLRGPEVRLQVRYEGPDVDQALAATGFTIQDVVHLGSRFLLAGPALSPESLDKAFCSFNASCVQNASCTTLPSAIQPAEDGVAHLQFTVGASAYICSGGLLNDTDTSSTVPLLLTANHCFSSSSSAASLEAYFQYTTGCGGACYNPEGAVPRVLGSTLLATNSTSDYTLVELSGSAPAGSTYLGWTTAAVANSNGTPLYRLSHPKGAPQAYSTHQVDTSKGTCGSWPRGDWIYSHDTYGATEGGSSGSPVLNASGQVVGQLSGACGTDPSNACAANANATVDGALAAYYSEVQAWLDPSTSCHVGSNGGWSYCSTSCKCDAGEGDCDSTSECNSGLTCVNDVGSFYGWSSTVDVCENPNSCVRHCGSQAPGGCWCDSACASYGDCCADKTSVCG